MKVILRKEAELKGLTRYFTGKSCKYGHISERHTRNGQCLECHKKRKKIYRKTERAIETSNKWRKENQYKRTAYQTKRETVKRKQMPIWADLNKIERVYLEASIRRKETGIKYVVDHIIPLQGKLVSGLHVENNLQILTDKENCEKGSNFILV